MSTYESEDQEQLQIRRSRGLASNVALTPANVRRVYGSVRTPASPILPMASRSGRQPNTDGFDTDDFLRVAFPSAAIGVGTPPTATRTAPTAGPSGVGTGTRRSAPTATTARSTMGVGSVTRRTTSAGKEPRNTTSNTQSASARRRANVRAAAELRRARQRTAAGAGGDGDGDGGDSSDGGSGRGRRGIRDDLDRLLNRLRRRADGRQIAGITHTDTITTTYKDGRPPTVRRSSTRSSGTSN